MDDNGKVTEKDIEEIATTATAMMDGITTLANVKGISREELESIYQIGYSYYETGKFDEAEKIFNFLVLFDHVNNKYWTAFGAARQAKKNFKGAYEAYAAAALYDLHAPKPHLYAAQCAFQLGMLDEAESGCRSLLHYCPAGVEGNDPLRAKAEKLLKAVELARQN